MSNRDLIRLENVDVRFGKTQALKQISFNLHDNCITTLIGPNGAGKTTLVRVVLGLIKPTNGSIWRDPDLRIGYMPQKLHIDRTMPLTVERFMNIPERIDSQRIDEALESVGAAYLRQYSIHDLSGGETQRVLLARAILRKPQLLVLDEPVQGVDINGQIELYQLIADIRKRYKCGVLMISHDLHLVMASTDHVICLNHHICCSGHPEKISSDPSFMALFGSRPDAALVPYSHHHNHVHDADGTVEPVTPAGNPGCGRPDCCLHTDER